MGYTMFPITKPDLWTLYKKMVGLFWTTEEVDLSKDLDGWEKLDADEKHFLKMVLLFFAGSDGIVFENIDLNFAQEIEWNEAKAFYACQAFNEMIHSEMYSLKIEKYISDQQEKDRMFRAIETVPCVHKKAQWALKWFDRSIPFAQRLVAFMCVEGIFFSGSFCAIFWLKRRGIEMPGLFFANELISRDEGLHLEFAQTLFSHLPDKPSPKIVHSIIKDAVEIEREFITESLPCKLIGMDADSMIQYIQFVADRILKQIGYLTIWDAKNPFLWMENIALDGKTNFFEKRVGEYSKHMDSTAVVFDEDF
jgi:ribonucleotide reductase beta subunit family protein with ferritin-like domain